YNHPISRVQAYRALSKAGKKCGLDDIGTHSLRKSFGYWHYQMYKDVAVLQDIFNHSSPSVTLRYIGINQDVKDQTIEKFFL
ncbi:tyrosine-type recombinase/integrase, partial [Lutibacter sp. B2]|nr:tyrosine-type recombinase/integrase [Lutibacter sp. B2]